MAQYIPKAAVVAVIENRIEICAKQREDMLNVQCYTLADDASARMAELNFIKDSLDTLEVKEVDLDEEIEKCLKQYHMIAVGKEEFEPIAKHFFELGLKIQKSEDKFARPDTDIKDAIKEFLEECGFNDLKEEVKDALKALKNNYG